MNIIVLDLEWNQTPYGKGSGKKEMPFEIIEIGAVKLDAAGREVGRFSEYVRPQVYRRLHPIMENILQIPASVLKEADIFQNVAKRFFSWCGTDYRFATWGSSDLTELQRNCRYFRLRTEFERPLFYYDVQKICSIMEKGDPKKLEAAIESFGIEKKEPFHHALSDAVYTAEIMKKLPQKQLDTYVSVDYFQNPKSRKEEISVRYPDALLFVSMEYDSKEEALLDKKLRSLPCIYCGRRLKKKLHWFSDGSDHFYCIGCCQKDGYILGKIHLKKTMQGKVFGVKQILPTDEARLGRMQQKKEFLRKKRREKRRAGHQS